MPTWKTHIKIAKDLLKKLDLNESDQELFLIGNILPDINNSYVVKDIKVKIEHQKTHYVNDEIPSYKKFYIAVHIGFPFSFSKSTLCSLDVSWWEIQSI